MTADLPYGKVLKSYYAAAVEGALPDWSSDWSVPRRRCWRRGVSPGSKQASRPFRAALSVFDHPQSREADSVLQSCPALIDSRV